MKISEHVDWIFDTMAQYSTTNDDYDFVLDNMPTMRDCQNNDGPTPVTNLGILLIFFISNLFFKSIAKKQDFLSSF